jgi:hypothetical protein
MARVNSKDTTNVYRYKVTTTGVYSRDGYGTRKGEAYTRVVFHGPYYTRVPFSPWTNPAETTTIETQKLGAFIDNVPHGDGNSYTSYLEWKTELRKVIDSVADDE